MSIIWEKRGKIIKTENVLEPTSFGYSKIVDKKETVIGRNSLVVNTDTGVIATITYHLGYGKWVLEISFCKDIPNMQHCNSIITRKCENKLQAIGIVNIIIKITQAEILGLDIVANQNATELDEAV
jgi:hypothetical protein